MTSSEFTADAMVRLYLRGRTLPEVLHTAVVWVAEARLSSGRMPVLDQTLRCAPKRRAARSPMPWQAEIPRLNTTCGECSAVFALLQRFVSG